MMTADKLNEIVGNARHYKYSELELYKKCCEVADGDAPLIDLLDMIPHAPDRSEIQDRIYALGLL